MDAFDNSGARIWLKKNHSLPVLLQLMQDTGEKNWNEERADKYLSAVKL